MKITFSENEVSNIALMVNGNHEMSEIKAELCCAMMSDLECKMSRNIMIG